MMQSSLACRSCAATGLLPILDLGSTPLANALLTSDQLNQPEETFPLKLVFCQRCSLVQITESVSPEKLFREYFYASSFSETMLNHAKALATAITADRHLDQNSLVIEVASNDGYLLQYYKELNVPVLGVEPAENIARLARARGIETVGEFFESALADKLTTEGRRADVIHAHNVLAHVPDLNGFVRGFRSLLKPTGVAVIEVPYVKDMIDKSEFDTIYHEHLCYFSLTALNHLFARHGMTIRDVERLALHGGTLRVYAEPGDRNPGRSVTELLAEEKDWVLDRDFYQGFEQKVETLRRDLVELLRSLKARNQRIAVYGASAKGSTMLNYFGIGRDQLDFVVDRSTVKQGRYTPGTQLPVVAPEKLLEERPDYVLLLTWNFADEILDQQAEYRARGGRFIIPIPQVKVV